MNQFVTAGAGIALVLMSAMGSANAASIRLDKSLFDDASHAAVIKVHSARKAHDTLHAFGYDRVVLLSTRESYDGYPIYKFRACIGRRAFRVQVNWYGNIVSQHRAGRCYRHREW